MELLEEISNVTMYQKAMNQIGIDNKILPISGLNKDVLNKAKDLLNQITKKV
jgi:hypothetical protein